jgi:ABC-type branched-subunit amino acid transport system substrate-binding protein
MISPTNTGLDLTKPLPGGRPGALEALYPTGRRNYVRLQGADDGTGAALAHFARDRGFERLAIVKDGSDYGQAIAWHARRTARRLGIAVVTHRIDVEAGRRRARALARRIARERPEALLHAGVPFAGPLQGRPPAFALVRELRKLMPAVPVLGPDSWADGPATRAELGREAHDVYFSYAGVPLERLPPAGRRFVAEFGATRPGGIVSSDEVYTAQATQLLLDAIARSDGSRPSVVRELFATRARNGLIGDVSFDPDGDVRPRPYSILRLSPRTAGTDLRDADLAAVVTPP